MEPQQPQTTTVGDLPQSSSTNSRIPLILGMILALLLVGAFSYFMGTRTQKIVIQEPSPTTSLATPDITITKTPNTETTFKDVWGIVSFTVPTGWQVDNHIVTNDKTSLEPDVEVISIQKNNDWKVTLSLKKQFKPWGCGGISFGKDEYDAYFNKSIKMSFLNTNAYRANIENGEFEAGGDSIPPYPQVISFEGPSYPAKIDDVNNPYYGKTIYDTAFCYENSSVPVQIGVEYFSNTFTQDNFENKNLDYATIHEMDKILESFQLLK